MNETREIARFVYGTKYEDLPPDLVGEFKIFVLDALGAGFIGSLQPWAKMVIEMVRGLGGKREASVINQSWKSDISRAALANGTMIGSFECEPLTGSHAAGTVLPAVMAVCEREHLDGKGFLTALVLGTEVSARIARTAVGLETERGFHNPGTQGPLAAAVAVGKLYGFDEATLVNALGIAGSCAAGLLEFAWEGANTKRIHLGRASQLGLESALLAQKGFTGPSTILEGRYGYYNAFSRPPNMEKLLDGIGQRWAVQPLSLKSFATHVTHQAVVQAIQTFKKSRELDPKKITRVAIRGNKHIMEERHSVRDPQSVMGGQYSLPFTTAVALTRDMSNPLLYDEQALRDPVVRDLANRVELIPVVEESGHSEPGAFSEEVSLEVGDESHRLPIVARKGSPKNPFTWEDVCEKFRRYAGRVIGKRQVSAIIKAVEDLNRCEDMANIASLVAARRGMGGSVEGR
ncbi:MAG: MmgE/PrpD family protein [Deltaproteobacteria bacterium]|nr:MmgE/PrpD family protein [Deltaproteobacteria bacterium]